MRVRLQRLPIGYREVEYLEAGSGQYIASNLNFNHTTSLEIMGKSYTSSTGTRGCVASEYSSGSSFGIEIITGIRTYNAGNPDFNNTGYQNDKINEYIVSFDRTNQTITSYCGGTTQTKTGLYGNNGVSFYIFVDRAKRFSTFNKTHRLYYLKMIKDGTLYCDLIPCIRTSDNKPGLYDTVNSTFYSNSGTGEFLYGPYKDSYKISLYPRLPSAYQEVEYIQSSGTQYINTGYIPTINNTRCVTKFMPLNTSDTAFFGARNGNNPFYFFYNIGGNYTWPISQATKVSGSSALAINTIYNIDWNRGDYKFYDSNMNLLEYATRSGSSPCNTSMYIFNFQPTDSRSTVARVYYFKIYDNDVLVRNFIPCYRKSDSVIGLFDIMNQQFYTNSGSGTFTKGNDVNYIQNCSPKITLVPSAYQEVEYIESSGTQYIDANITLDNEFEIILDQMNNFDTNNHYMVGSGTSGKMLGTLGNVIWCNGVVYSTVGFDRNVRQTLGIQIVSDGSSYSDFVCTNYTTNTRYSGHSSYYVRGGSNVFVFNVPGHSGAESFKCYDCKIFKSGTLVRHFVPCYRKSDSVVGMWDTIQGRFYTNAGTGTFTKGSNKYTII